MAATLPAIESPTHIVKDEFILPWKRRPERWLIGALFISSLASSATLSSRYEVYSQVLHAMLGRKDACPVGTEIMMDAMRTFGSVVVQPSCRHYGLNSNANTAVWIVVSLLPWCTGAWWGALSDRYGRRRVLFLSALGSMIAEVAIMLVFLTSTVDNPRAYWLIIIGALCDGVLGGTATATVAALAYVVDKTSVRNRSLVLSVTLGSVLAGATIGPRVSVVFYALTSINKALATFTIAAACHAIYTAFILFMLPESLSRLEMKAARQQYAATLQSSEGCIKRAMTRVNLANPLTLLGPNASSTTPGWSLTLLVISYAVGFMLIDGPYQFAFFTSGDLFEWPRSIRHYAVNWYASYRILAFCLVIPVGMMLVKKKAWLLAKAHWDSAIVTARSDVEECPKTNAPATSPSFPGTKTAVYAHFFDFGVARAALYYTVFMQAAVAFATQSSEIRVFTAFGALGAAFQPTLMCIILALHSQTGQQEVGRVLGGLSFVQAISGQLVGRVLYTLIYHKLFSSAALPIYLVSAAIALLVYGLLAFVELPGDSEEL